MKRRTAVREASRSPERRSARVFGARDVLDQRRVEGFEHRRAGQQQRKHRANAAGTERRCV